MEQTEKEFLDSYDESKYKHPSCTVDMLLFTVINKELKLLLIKRKGHPFKDCWALPGGFIDYYEDMEEAVLRELSEETNITNANYFRQLYTLGKADRDPRTRVISTAYMSLTSPENLKNLKAGDDAGDARWWTVSKVVVKQNESSRVSSLILRNDEDEISYVVEDTVVDNYIKTTSLCNSKLALAFDHVKTVNMAVDKLQHGVASSGLLFNLLPSEFTLKEAQNAFEAIKGVKTDTGNFRRDIVKMLVPTGNTKKSYNKQAELFKFNPMFQYLKEDL